MSLSDWPKFDTNGKLNVYDGTGTPLSILGVPYVDGDVKVTGLAPICNELLEGTARGQLSGVGYGDPTFPTITLSEEITQLIATSAPGPLRDFLTQTGAYSTNVSTFGAGKPRAVHVELVQQGADFGDPDDTLKLWNVAFPQYDYMWGRPNKHAWTGKVYGVPSTGVVATINGTTVCRRINSRGT